MRCARMKRSSASGPPWRGAGSPRTCGGSPVTRGGVMTDATDARVVCAGSMAEDSLAQRLLAGDKRALARAITLVEYDDPAGWELVREVYPHTGNAAVVGLTGRARRRQVDADRRADQAAPRGRAATVAVLSIDPSSPFTHGALLGDRIRLTEHFLDPGVFIRSMANRGALGGLSEAALQAALLMDAAGQGRRLPGDRRRRPGRGRHHRPRRHGRARADARLGRLDPGAEGRRSWRSPTSSSSTRPTIR